MDALRAIAMSAGDTWTATGLPRVAMVRAEACSNQVYGPMLHLVLQGSKSLSIGGQVVHIEAPGYFVVPVALPALGQVTAQSGTAPYLAVSLALDPAIIAAMLADLPAAGKVPHGADVGVAQAGPDLIDAWLRMMQLVARPDDVAMMAPLIEREILFRMAICCARSRTPTAACRRCAARSTGFANTWRSRCALPPWRRWPG